MCYCVFKRQRLNVHADKKIKEQLYKVHMKDNTFGCIDERTEGSSGMPKKMVKVASHDLAIESGNYIKRGRGLKDTPWKHKIKTSNA